jgi:hypothetical protein
MRFKRAQESANDRDVYRLAGITSSLTFAARYLCWTADMDPNNVPLAVKPEAGRARLETDIQLTHDARAPRL